jgi:hypothetical protein
MKLVSLLDDRKDRPILLTPFTFIHTIVGSSSYLLLSNLTNLSFINSFILFSFAHLLYELKDYYYSYVKGRNGSQDNSIYNGISDQIFSMLGFALAPYIFINPSYHPIVVIISIIITILFGIFEMT